MSNIVPFTPGAPVGDWTSGERARLSELAERLMARGARVEVAYGVSDAGDPWCVIQDERDEVLIHIARIDGEFVIHDAAQDAVRRTDTLWSALKRLLGAAEATVVDLRKAQALLALVMATLFVEEALRGHGPPLDVRPPAPEPDSDTPAPSAETPLPHTSASADMVAGNPHALPDHATSSALHSLAPSEIDLVAHLRTAGSLTGVAAATASAPAAAAAPAQGPVAEVATPASGPDFQAPPRPANDQGGGRIAVADGGVARGTAGQDQFVIEARATSGPNFGLAASAQPSAPAGVILDFGAGDKLVLASGAAASIVSVTAVADILSEPSNLSMLAKTAGGPAVRVGVDVNGDGVEDAYVLVAGPGVATLSADHGAPAPQDTHGEAPIGLVAPAPAEPPLFG